MFFGFLRTTAQTTTLRLCISRNLAAVRNTSTKSKKAKKPPKKLVEETFPEVHLAAQCAKQKGVKKSSKKLVENFLNQNSQGMVNKKRILCVAEKNDAAKNIAYHLSNGRAMRREGFSKYNKLYIFDTNFRGFDANFVFTSVAGHLSAIDFVKECQNWNQYPIRNLFTARVTRFVPKSMQDIQRTLKHQVRSAHLLMIWTDCDREGENIGAEIAQVCREENRGIEILRARFSEITPIAVLRALQNPDQIDMRVSDAVDCRMELDLRIGAAFTRLQTLHLQGTGLPMEGSKNGKKVVSYGSCQFPTLGFIVERWKAINSHISEPFWRLVGRDPAAPKIEFNWERIRVFDNAVADVYKEICDGAHEPAKVILVDRHPKNKWRPTPMNTVEMEKLAIRNLRMNAKRVMTSAEKLYQKGFISYPRTETTIFPEGIDLRAIVVDLANNPIFRNFATNEILNRGRPNPRKGSKTDKAHPPIHPVKNATKNEITGGDDWSLYEMICRHFLACVSRDAKAQETKIKVDLGEEKFNATGLQIEDLGYLQIYPYEKWTDKPMPNYQMDQTIPNFKVTLTSGRTEPPKLLNEADLITLMDRNGIGTDATHSEHIEKIKIRGYVSLNRENRFEPSHLGISLVEGYDRMNISDLGYDMDKPLLRAQLESGLVDICEGRNSKTNVLGEQLNIYKTIFETAEIGINRLSECYREQLRPIENIRRNNRNANPPNQ